MFLFSHVGSQSGPAPQAELQFDATVEYCDVEGGAWVIERSDGTTDDPTDLPQEYGENGLPVRVWANRAEEQAGFRIVGPIISIQRIEPLDTDG